MDEDIQDYLYPDGMTDQDWADICEAD